MPNLLSGKGLALVLTACSLLSFASSAWSAESGQVQWQEGHKVGLPGQASFMSWIDPQTRPWASVLCIHGLGFHKESYSAFAKRLAKLGIATYALDVRGFGSYVEQRPKARVDYDLSFRDIKEALTTIRTETPEIPVFILGESMGGAMALQAATRYPQLVDGVVSSVPAFNTWRNLPAAFKVAAVAMTKGPNGQVSIAGDVVERSTNNAIVQERVLENSATRKHLTVRDMLAYRKLMTHNRSAVRMLATTPVLMVQGFKDKLIGPGATTKMFNRIATLDKDLILVGNAQHLVFEEGQFSDDTIDSVVSWLNKHSYGGTPVAMLPSQLSKVATPVETVVSSQPIAPDGTATAGDAKIAAHTESGTNAETAGDGASTGNSNNDASDGKVVPVVEGAQKDSKKSGVKEAAIDPIASKLAAKLGTVDKTSVVIFFSPTTPITQEQLVLERAVQKLSKGVNCIKLNVIDKEARQIADHYGVTNTPTALVFDRNLKKVGTVEGGRDVASAENKIKAAMVASVQ